MWFGNGYLSPLYACPRRVIIMYDVMLDYPIHFSQETALNMDFTKGMKYQKEDYRIYYYETEDKTWEGLILESLQQPKSTSFSDPKDFRMFNEAWKGQNWENKFYLPVNIKNIRNFGSWDSFQGTNHFKMKPMLKHNCNELAGTVWRKLSDGKYKQIGIELPNGIDHFRHTEYFDIACRDYYSDRFKSVFLANRFKDSDTTTMNIYVGETVNDMLNNFTLDIPQEQFVFPYPHGVSFVRKDYTTYLYEDNDEIYWSYFGKDGKFRMNAIKYQDIINNGRISEKSIHRFYKAKVKGLKTDLDGFMNSYFEDTFGIKTEDVGNNVLSKGVICSLFQSVYGINAIEDGEHDNSLTIHEDKTDYPNLADCINIIIEDLMKIICLNDRDFAKEKLKKTSKGKAISSKINPKRIGRRYFKWGEDDIVYVYPTNSHNGAKLRRHIRRGHTKKQPIKYPKNYGGKAFQMDGAWYVSKTIAPYWAGGKSTIPENQISPFCFGAIKMKYAGGSRIASQWIREMEKQLGRKLAHNENGGKEYRIQYNDGKWFFIDAWDEETNTVYEFHGDYFHGNPNLFNAEDLNKTVKKTYGELYEATMQKKQILEEMGYNYVCVWESDFINLQIPPQGK